MSTLSIAETPSTVLIDLDRPAVPLSRLVAVETRKLFNTRAAFWLSAVIVLASVAIAGIAAFTIDSLSFANAFQMMQLTTGVLLPVLAILLVTSEWSQRSALVTFGLEPRRSRVVVAKLATSIGAALLAVASMAVFAAVGTALAGVVGNQGVDPWQVSAPLFGNALIITVLALLMGFGFGMVLRNSPAAIVLFFALPTVWSIAASLVPWIQQNLQEWADFNLASLSISGLDWASGQDWLRVATSGAIWILLPLVVGIRRLVRSEVK